MMLRRNKLACLSLTKLFIPDLYLRVRPSLPYSAPSGGRLLQGKPLPAIINSGWKAFHRQTG